MIFTIEYRVGIQSTALRIFRLEENAVETFPDVGQRLDWHRGKLEVLETEIGRG